MLTAILGAIIAFGLSTIVFLWQLHRDIGPLARIAKAIEADAIERWLRDKGLLTPPAKAKPKKRRSEGNPLPPEKARRREELVAKGKQYGLTQDEAEELEALLKEEARSDFVEGVIGTLAFLALVAAIAGIVRALTRRT